MLDDQNSKYYKMERNVAMQPKKALKRKRPSSSIIVSQIPRKVMRGGLGTKMLWKHLSVSCVPIIQRAVVPSSIQPSWKRLQSFPRRLFFALPKIWSPVYDMLIRLIEYLVTLSLKFVTVLLSILFPRYVKILSIQCFPIYIEYKVETFLIEKELIVKT